MVVLPGGNIGYHAEDVNKITIAIVLFVQIKRIERQQYLENTKQLSYSRKISTTGKNPYFRSGLNLNPPQTIQTNFVVLRVVDYRFADVVVADEALETVFRVHAQLLVDDC